jgi:hypothetical protein
LVVLRKLNPQSIRPWHQTRTKKKYRLDIVCLMSFWMLDRYLSKLKINLGYSYCSHILIICSLHAVIYWVFLWVSLLPAVYWSSRWRRLVCHNCASIMQQWAGIDNAAS